MTRQHLPYPPLLVFCTILLLCTIAGQAMGTDEPDISLPEQITDFKTCALTSLKRTPQLQRSKIEIEIRHLDEDDSRWSYVPDLVLSSYYYFAEDNATISLNAANYRPWEPYYTLQARKLITRIVMLKHLEATNQALHTIADTLLQLILLDQNEFHFKQIATLSEKNLRYARQRHQSGTAASLELELEEQKFAFISAEHEGNTIKREVLLNGMCITMNLPSPDIFNLDGQQVLQQILGNSDSLELQNLTQPGNSINQQVIAIQENLQKKKITLAYSQYMPNISLGFRSPDVLNVSIDNDQEYFFYTGISLTIWDGKKRSRDITRQKMILRQMQFENKEIENNESLKWLRATQEYAAAKSEYALAQSGVKLKQIQMKKREIDYAGGTIQLPEIINHKIALHRKKLHLIQKQFSLRQKMLKLRYLSGTLINDTFNISLADIPYE